MHKAKDFYFKKFSLHIGMSSRFGVGIYVDSMCAGIDLVCFWISVEY